MRTRVVVSVVVISLTLGVGWFVGAQNSSGGLPTFVSGDILAAVDLNAIVSQVVNNTEAIAASNDDNGSTLTCDSTLWPLTGSTL